MAETNRESRNGRRGREGLPGSSVGDAATYLKSVVDGLPESSLPTLIGTLAEAKARAQAKLVLPRATAAEEEKLLKRPEAAVMLGTTQDWLSRHGSVLPFTVRLSSGQVRYSRTGIRDFIVRGGQSDGR